MNYSETVSILSSVARTANILAAEKIQKFLLEATPRDAIFQFLGFSCALELDKRLALLSAIYNGDTQPSILTPVIRYAVNYGLDQTGRPLQTIDEQWRYYIEDEDLDVDQVLESIAQLIKNGVPLSLMRNLIDDHFSQEIESTGLDTLQALLEKNVIKFDSATENFVFTVLKHPEIYQQLAASAVHYIHYDSLEDFAQEHSLDSLKHYADPELTMDFCYLPVFDEDCLQLALSSFLQEEGLHQNAHSIIVNNMSEFDSDTEEECREFLSNLFMASSSEVISFLCDLLSSEEAFDFKHGFQLAQLHAEECGALTEAQESVDSYEPIDGIEFVWLDSEADDLEKRPAIPLSTDSIFDKISASCYLDESEHFDLDSLIRDIAFESELLDIKLNDLNVPYYGFSGFDQDEYSYQVLNSVLHEIGFSNYTDVTDTEPQVALAA